MAGAFASYQNEIYLGRLEDVVPELAADLTRLEAMAEERMPADGVRLCRRLGRLGGDRACQPRGVRALADRAADAARRLRRSTSP